MPRQPDRPILGIKTADRTKTPEKVALAERILYLRRGTTLKQETDTAKRMNQRQWEAHAAMLADQFGVFLDRAEVAGVNVFPFRFDRNNIQAYAQARKQFLDAGLTSITEEQATTLLETMREVRVETVREKLQTAHASARRYAETPPLWALREEIKSYDFSKVLPESVLDFVSQKAPAGNVLVGDLMSPTTLVRDLSDKVYDKTQVRITTVALDLYESRQPAQRIEDEDRDIHLAEGDILTRKPWMDLKKLALAKGGFDLLVSSPAGPLHLSLTDRPQVLFGLLDRAYRLLKNATDTQAGGTLLFDVPKNGFIRNVSSFDIEQWIEKVTKTHPGIEIVYATDATKVDIGKMRITKKTGAPEKLPTGI